MEMCIKGYQEDYIDKFRKMIAEEIKKDYAKWSETHDTDPAKIINFYECFNDPSVQPILMD